MNEWLVKYGKSLQKLLLSLSLTDINTATNNNFNYSFNSNHYDFNYNNKQTTKTTGSNYNYTTTIANKQIRQRTCLCKTSMMFAKRRRNQPTIKQLESCLQNLNDFDKPKVELEQYATPPHIAAIVLNTIQCTYNDLEGKFVCDLGCGTGRLSVGSILCNATMVFGVDIDRDALELALENINDTLCDSDDEEEFNSGADNRDNLKFKVYECCRRFNFIQADIVSESSDAFWESMAKKFDTVIMNPPFGTKQRQGLDMCFLKRAINLAESVVYSLHKTSTRAYIKDKCQQWQVEGKPIAQIRYNLENTYKFHKKKSVDIDVDLWRIRIA